MRSEFNVHMLNSAGLEKANALGEIFSKALSDIEAIVPAGRERALVVTGLQEAAFWAKRGIAIDPANQLIHKTTAAGGGVVTIAGGTIGGGGGA